MFVNNDRYTTTTFNSNISALPTTVAAASKKNRIIQFATDIGSVRTDAFDEEQIIKKLLERLAKKPIVEYKCHNCGAPVELEEDKHIFICKYCGSVYAVGTKQINSVY